MQAKAKKAAASKERAVVVTTAHKGVFFGYTKDGSGADPMHLCRARLCLYWSAAVNGFMGLAATGPNSDCRIGPRANIELRAITSVIDCTPEAVTAWEKA